MNTDKRENVTFAERKKEFELQIQNAETIAISGHMNPDGDCIGSCLGLYTYIVEQYPEKQVTLLLEPVQEKFSFLKYADQITQKKESTEPYDLFFSLDCSDTERLHEFKKYFEEAKYKICVDHHFTNQGFGDLQFIVPDASSTCEVLFSMFDWEKISSACPQDLLFMIQVYSNIPIQQERRWRQQVLYLKKESIQKISLIEHFTKNLMCRIRYLEEHLWKVLYSYMEK